MLSRKLSNVRKSCPYVLDAALLMICPWFVDIDTKTKNDPYIIIIIYKIS